MRLLPTISACLLAGVLSAAPQENQNPTPRPDEVAAAAEQKAEQAGAVFGKIKGIEAGRKIVVEVENGKDKTYSLTDPKHSVNVAEGLAVGDRVRVLESENKSVQIVRDTTNAGSRQQGERSRTAEDNKKQDR